MPLRTHDDGFYVDVTDPARTADVPADGTFAWHLLVESDALRIAITPVDDPDEPLTVDERAAVALDDDSWTESVATGLDDEETVEAVREIHGQQADFLLRRTDADGDRFENRIPVDIEPRRDGTRTARAPGFRESRGRP